MILIHLFIWHPHFLHPLTNTDLKSLLGNVIENMPKDLESAKSSFSNPSNRLSLFSRKRMKNSVAQSVNTSGMIKPANYLRKKIWPRHPPTPSSHPTLVTPTRSLTIQTLVSLRLSRLLSKTLLSRTRHYQITPLCMQHKVSSI